MNTVMLNHIHLNSVPLNSAGCIRVKVHGGGGGGGGTPGGDIPEGYSLFHAADGVFSAADGKFYVKL